MEERSSSSSLLACCLQNMVKTWYLLISSHKQTLHVWLGLLVSLLQVQQLLLARRKTPIFIFADLRKVCGVGWLLVGCFPPYKHTDVDSYHTPCVHNNYLLLTCIFRSVLESVPTTNRSLSAWIFAFSSRFFLLECGRTSPGLLESYGVCPWWEWVTYSSYYAPCNLMCGFFTCTSVENGGDSR